jgi:hypothetical protein
VDLLGFVYVRAEARTFQKEERTPKGLMKPYLNGTAEAVPFLERLFRRYFRVAKSIYCEGQISELEA